MIWNYFYHFLIYLKEQLKNNIFIPYIISSFRKKRCMIFLSKLLGIDKANNVEGKLWKMKKKNNKGNLQKFKIAFYRITKKIQSLKMNSFQLHFILEKGIPYIYHFLRDIDINESVAHWVSWWLNWKTFILSGRLLKFV